jgi:DNA-binding transcriptional regulator YdaS (Cro superfamily)
VPGVYEAVRKAGSQRKLAKKLGVSQQFVCDCVQQGYFPVQRAVEIEREYGVSRLELVSPKLKLLLTD